MKGGGVLHSEVERARHDARTDGGATGAAKVLGGKSSTEVPCGTSMTAQLLRSRERDRSDPV